MVLGQYAQNEINQVSLRPGDVFHGQDIESLVQGKYRESVELHLSS